MANGNFIKNLQGLYGFTFSKVDGNSKKSLPVPAELDKKTNKISKIKLSDDIIKLYKYWLDDVFDSSETLKNRVERYQQLDFAYYNNSIFSKAVNLHADETVQPDAQNETVEIVADSKVRNFIQEFFDDIGVTQSKLREVAFNLTLMGDAAWVTPTNGDNGYNEIFPIDVYSLKDRIEFNAIEVGKKVNKRKLNNLVQKDQRLQVLLDRIEATEDYSQYFKNFLFAFQVEDLILPAWNVMHFRLFTTKSEFYPYGRSIMINSLAPFRQLQTLKNLMALGRASNFPIKHFGVKGGDNSTPADKWELVNETREEFHNLIGGTTDKEEFAINGEVWTPDDLITFQSIENRVDLNKTGDVELLRDDLIMGTNIPKGYLIVDRGAFGTSGQALLKQHKPFATAIYYIQSAILNELVSFVKRQFVITGKFSHDTPFELSMSFPAVEESSDRIRIKSDSIRLAKDTIDNITQALGLERGEALPSDVIKKIFSSLSFMDKDDVDDWIDSSFKAIEKNKNIDNVEVDVEENKKIRNKINDRLSESLINDSYFLAKKRNSLKEGRMGNKHYCTNINTSSDDKYLLTALDHVRKDNKLLEDDISVIKKGNFNIKRDKDK